ncbi:MAG: hypothetical protein MPN21_25890 [Thermoanaerobaculia bacterium]|nr:hypothetical protein [Thermoanaerobaculia bacterium]
MVKKREQWLEFEKEVGVPFTYLHEDELQSIFDSMGVTSIELPCILVQTVYGKYHTVLGKNSLARTSGRPLELQARILHHLDIRGLGLTEATEPLQQAG